MLNHDVSAAVGPVIAEFARLHIPFSDPTGLLG